MESNAVLERAWIEKYISFFKEKSEAGGAVRITLKAEIKNSSLILTDESFYGENTSKEVYWGKPLPETSKYYEGI